MTNLTFYSRHFEADNVYTFTFSTGGLHWRAGQYFALVMPKVSPVLELYEHWFSISSPPYRQQIQITIRQSDSLFKQALFDLKPGDTIQAHTVDGDFSWPEDYYPIMVAGGIGITPFISMLRQRDHEQLPLKAQLFYFNRHHDILFKSELDALSRLHPGLMVHYLFDKPLSLEPLTKLQPRWENSLTFLAGPVPMVDRLGQELHQRQLRYKQDYYFGYDIRNF